MARIRSLKPEHRAHRKVGTLSDREYRLWVSMIVESDDEGRFIADSAQLRAQTWPYHDVDVDDVEAAIKTIAKSGTIRLYRVGKIRYGCFPSWGKHQHPKYPQRSSNPPPPFPHHSPNGAGTVRKRSPSVPRGVERVGLSREDREDLRQERVDAVNDSRTSTEPNDPPAESPTPEPEPDAMRIMANAMGITLDEARRRRTAAIARQPTQQG